MRLHQKFEWDREKAIKNLEKHAVSFDDAQIVLSDEQGDFFHVEQYDDKHSVGEDRFITMASDPFRRTVILVIVWTQRTDENEAITRIISARAATANERKAYAKQIGPIE